MIERKSTRSKIVFIVVLVGIIIAVVVIITKYTLIRDFFRGLSYKPTTEMMALKEKLDLTDKSELIFNSSWPELNKKDEFNHRCRAIETSAAILGCYTDERIYVYNVVDKRLDGIREATLAHELLHAVYARMSEDEKNSLKEALDSLYSENKDILESELAMYQEDERYEELYVRAGTEIAKLPAILERHFESYFNDQDRVAGYYVSYASVFKELNQKISELGEQLENLLGEIEMKKHSYEQDLAVLNAEILDFNSCADTEGCFTSDYEFYIRRNELVLRQEELARLYDDVNGLVDYYNELVNEYNNNIIYSQTLNNIVNSVAQSVDIE